MISFISAMNQHMECDRTRNESFTIENCFEQLLGACRKLLPKIVFMRELKENIINRN